MSRRRSRSYVVPQSRGSMQQFKAEVMRNEGYDVKLNEPDSVKFEVARSMGIALDPIYNGNLKATSAGQIGGRIGGLMVKEMVRMAKETLAKETIRMK